jgi:hypothetical protein
MLISGMHPTKLLTRPPKLTFSDIRDLSDQEWRDLCRAERGRTKKTGDSDEPPSPSSI